jgi:hypothetical protein
MPPAPVDVEALRLAIYRWFMERSRPPTVAELVAELAVEADAVEAGIERLHEQRQLVLTPERTSIRMAHPFSAEPMGFVVEGRGTMWWGGCAWDSFAIGAALSADVTVTTRCPQCARRITAHVDERGRVDGDAFVAHFLIPVRRFWDDVVYTCSNQRMFCGVEHVRAWLAEAQVPLGAVLTPEQLWDLASRWYRERLKAGGRRPTSEEAREHFAAIGLTGDFWRLA